MEIVGTSFVLTLGSWRMRIGFTIEDADAPQPTKPPIPHRMRLIPDDDYIRREA
jgi:hypothetical protein